MLLTIEAPGQVHVGMSLSSGVSCSLKQILDALRKRGGNCMTRARVSEEQARDGGRQLEWPYESGKDSGGTRRRQHADWAREGTRPLIRRPLITKD